MVVLLLILGSIISSAFLGEGAIGLLVTLSFMSRRSWSRSPRRMSDRRSRRRRAPLCSPRSQWSSPQNSLSYEAVATLGFFATMIALSVATPLAIGHRLWKHPVISTNTIAGAADIYLLIGLLFAVIYASSERLKPAALACSTQARRSTSHRMPPSSTQRGRPSHPTSSTSASRRCRPSGTAISPRRASSAVCSRTPKRSSGSCTSSPWSPCS